MSDAINPLKPWQHIKSTLFIGYYRFKDGRLYSPWGMFETAWYAHKTFVDPRPRKQPTGHLDVSITESDARGFAIYGMVRVSGTSVIPC